jgi:Domain of unknown function (DUF4258)
VAGPKPPLASRGRIRKQSEACHCEMNDSFRRIIDLVHGGDVQISAHGYDEMAEDGIFAGEVIDGVEAGVMIEDYPDYPRGPCTLVLQRDRSGSPIHVVWGIPRGQRSPGRAGHRLST